MNGIGRFTRMLVGLVLTGCTNSGNYAQPSTLTSQNAATLIGSRIHSDNVLMADTLIMPAQIDGQIMARPWYNDASSRWNKAFLIAPGVHQILVEISIGGTFDQAAVGNAEFEVPFQSGKTYHILATAPVSDPQSKFLLLCYTWLQDDAGQSLTPHLPVPIHIFTGGDMITLPSGSGQTPTFIAPHP